MNLSFLGYVNSGVLRSSLLKNLCLDVVDVDLHLAVVGFGKMGILHSTILNLLNPGIVKFVVDKSSIINLGGKLLGSCVRFFKSVERLLEEDLDAVYVTSPVQTHYAIVKRLLEAGVKAVFIEKPPTLDLASFMELHDSSRGNLTMVGFQKRYALPFRHAKLLLDEGAIGDIQDVKCYIRSSDILQSTNRFDSLGRGVLLDLGIHLLDLLCWFFGRLNVEESSCKSLFTRVDDFFTGTISTDSFKVEFEASWSDRRYRLPETFIKVKCDNGIITVSEDYLKFELESEGKSLALYKPHYYHSFPPVLVADPEYTVEDLHFLSCLTTGARPHTSLESCKTTMELMEELYGRVKHGQGATVRR